MSHVGCLASYPWSAQTQRVSRSALHQLCVANLIVGDDAVRHGDYRFSVAVFAILFWLIGCYRGSVFLFVVFAGAKSAPTLYGVYSIGALSKL